MVKRKSTIISTLKYSQSQVTERMDVVMRDAGNGENAQETNIFNNCCIYQVNYYLGHSLARLRDNSARKSEMR